MTINQLAIRDAQSIVSKGIDFAVPIILTSPTAVTRTVYALQTKHHNGMDGDGFKVSARQHSVVVSEKDLLGYPYLSQTGDISFKNHIITTVDSLGQSQTFLVQDWFPDRTVGIIVLILQKA